MKWTGALSFLCVMGLMVTGCAHGADDTLGNEEKNPVTLRTVTMFGAEDAYTVVYQQIMREFEAEYNYITIEDESRTSDESWKEQIAADFCVGNEPDVLQFFTDATANQLIATDKFVTLEEIQKEYPEYAADTYDWALDQIANADGVRRAVPTVGFWEGVYCNQDLFDAYDVPLPTDWDSLVYAIRVFREHDIVPIACSLCHVPHYWTEYFLLYSSGEEAYTVLGQEAPKEWEKGLQLFAELRELEAFPSNTDSVNNEYVWRLFSNKQAAMLLEGSWYLPLVEDQDNTVVIPFPGTRDENVMEGTIIGGMTTGFYITRRAWNNPDKRDAAVKYVMAHTSSEAVQRYWESSGGTAAPATDVEPMEERTPLAESAASYLEKAERRVLPTDSRMHAEAYNVLISGIVNVSHGGAPSRLLDRVFEIQSEAEK